MDRPELVLTPPIAPMELRRPLAHEEAMTDAMRRAIAAALAGDDAEYNELELEFVNLLVRIGELFVKDANGTPHWWFSPHDERYRRVKRDRDAPFVIDIHRGFGPQGVTAFEWCIGEKCRRCDGRLRHDYCRVCQGKWHLIGIAEDVLFTDAEGVLLQEAP